ISDTHWFLCMTFPFPFLPVVCHDIVVTPGRAFGISGLVPQALLLSHLSIVEPGVGEPIRHTDFSFLDVVGEGVKVGAARTTGGYGAGSGKDQLLAAVAFDGDVRRMPLVDLPERDFTGLVVRIDALDDLRHRLRPSCRPAHPAKANERQRD